MATTRRTTQAIFEVEHVLEDPKRRVTQAVLEVEHVLADSKRRVTQVIIEVEHAPAPPGGIQVLRCGFDREHTFGGYTSLDGDYPSHEPRAHTHEENEIVGLIHNAIQLRGREISPAAPADWDVLGYDGADARWEPFGASPNPGATESFLRTNASGYIELVGVGIGAAAGAANRITMVDGGSIGQAAGPLVTFDDANNYLEIAGCNVGVRTTTPLTVLQVDRIAAFSLATAQAGQDNLFLRSESTPGSGVFGASLGFSRIDGFGSRRPAGIVAVQTGTDSDRVGLAFFTHPSTVGSAASVEAVRITHAGLVGLGTPTPAGRLEVTEPTVNQIVFRLSRSASDFVQVRTPGGTPQAAQIEVDHSTGAVADAFFIYTQSGGNYSQGDVEFRQDAYVSGVFGINETAPGGQQQITIASHTIIGLIIKGDSGQAADLTQWQSDLGAVLAHVNPDASFHFGGAANYLLISAGGVVSMAGTAKRVLTLRPAINAITQVAHAKPTEVTIGVFKGYSFPIYAADNEELFLSASVPGRWDEASDLEVHVLCVLSAAEDVGDSFQFRLGWNNVADTSDIVPATSHDVDVEQAVLVGRAAQYNVYTLTFTIDYDADGVGNEIQSHDLLGMRLRRIDASDPDVANEIIVLDWHDHYDVDKMFAAP